MDEILRRFGPLGPRRTDRPGTKTYIEYVIEVQSGPRKPWLRWRGFGSDEAKAREAYAKEAAETEAKRTERASLDKPYAYRLRLRSQEVTVIRGEWKLIEEMK